MWIFYRPDAITVWENEEVRNRLSWYRKVMVNEKPAKYLICKRIEADIDLKDAGYDELWHEHERLAIEFNKTWNKIKNGELELADLRRAKISFLDLKVEIANRILENCHFCERRCGVNRKKGEKGFCKLTDKSFLASYFHHYGEEAPLVPSSTFFMSSCTFRCVHCQNWDISTDPTNGIEITPPLLATLIEKLRKEGGLNTNFVGGDPVPHIHTIIEAMKYTDINVPMLWNSNFYMSTEATKLLIHIIDIGLPDFKYGNDFCALRLSNVSNYFEVVSRNHKMFHDESIDSIVRILVLPNHVECCVKPVLKWLADNCPNFLVNIMSQYRPCLLYTSPSPRDLSTSRMPSSA